MYKCLDGRMLKLIAVLSMLTDHIGAVLFPKLLILRIIGRIAFPIYCFLLVEGAIHTHDIKKYMMRMALFVVISEIPFDLAFFDKVIDIRHQNVFFTLFLGLLLIFLCRYMTKKYSHFSETANSMMQFLLFIAVGLLAELLHTDYGFSGIAMIFIFYLVGDNKVKKYILIALLCIAMGWVEAFAIIALIPIALYNGKRGRQSKLMQYGFYAFYPVHLIILAILKSI